MTDQGQVTKLVPMFIYKIKHFNRFQIFISIIIFKIESMSLSLILSIMIQYFYEMWLFELC